jgi:chondroitin-sulfate-ABC endolyase/exolyase
VPQLPQQKLAEAWSGGRTYAPETFMGGLSHKGTQGVFGMILNQTVRPDTTFTGRKSWFLNDNYVICLGSDIFCDEAQYPTQTTLCQKGLQTNEEGELLPTIVNGAEVTTFPEEIVLAPAEPHWFIDVQQTGYYLPTGQAATVARRHQTSRSGWDEEDTEGDFLTAWIDHGIAPDSASYEYMLAVRATPEEMQKIVATPPYQVVQHDHDAHIVWLGEAGRWGCVLFVEQEVTAHTAGGHTLPVKAVDRPCLVMAELAGDGQLDISVANPDLNMDPPTGNHILSRPQSLRVTLRGRWSLAEATGTVNMWSLPDAAENVRIVSSDADETVLEIVAQHGASYDISLVRP